MADKDRLRYRFASLREIRPHTKNENILFPSCCWAIRRLERKEVGMRETKAERECTEVKRREDSAKPNPKGAQASARSPL